jgi:sensor histidine kinase YesM
MNNRKIKQDLRKKKILQLQADILKTQINPHLIYNALNDINGLINLEQKEEAQNYLMAFSDMLRLVFQNTNKNEITLQNELDITKSFVEFHQQSKAYNFDLKIESFLNVDSNNILIPPVIIQPFVENAILHGFSKPMDEKGFIIIQTKNIDSRLIISVEDNGVGMGNSAYSGNGTGIKLTRERIKLLEKRPDNPVRYIDRKQGTKVVINIPLKLLQ